MRVVLDTNVFFRDLRFKSPKFQLLLSILTGLEATLVVPGVVRNEIVKKFRDEVEEAISKTEKPLAKLTTLTGLDLSIPKKEDLPKIVAEYDEYASGFFRDIGATVLQFPEVRHEDVFERIFMRRKPFKVNHDGYRDYLIWRELLDQATRYNDVIVFVTENSSDFLEGDHLHPDLLEDLRRLVIAQERIPVFQSLESFINGKSPKSFWNQKDLAAAFTAGDVPTLDLHKWLAENKLGIARMAKTNNRDLGLPEEFQIRGINGLRVAGVFVEEVRQIEDAKMILLGTLYGTVEVSGYLHLTYYSGYESRFDLRYIDEDEDRMVLAETSRHVGVEINLIVDKALSSVLSWGIGGIFRTVAPTGNLEK